jgi:hypothetical protein
LSNRNRLHVSRGVKRFLFQEITYHLLDDLLEKHGIWRVVWREVLKKTTSSGFSICDDTGGR